MEVVIEVDSKNVCVETLAKQRYWSAVNFYMKKLQEGLEDVKLEKEIEILKRLLEDTDMEKLRAQIDCCLDEGKKVVVVLREKNGRIVHEVR